MSEWFDILKQSRQTSLSEFGVGTTPRIRRVKTQPTQRGRTSGANKLPPSMRLKPQLQQQELEQRRQAQARSSPKPKIDSQTGGQFSPLSAKPVYGIQEQALANPDPTYKNLSVQEVKELKRAGMTAAQIRNINNQSSTQNQMQSPNQRRLAQAKELAGRATGYVRQKLGQRTTPSSNQPIGPQAFDTTPTGTNVAARPDPQVIQDLNNQIQQMKAEVAGNPAARPRLEALEAQLQAEQNKGKLHGTAIKPRNPNAPMAGTTTTTPPPRPRTPRPFSAQTNIQTMAKSEWFNVLYSHQTM